MAITIIKHKFKLEVEMNTTLSSQQAEQFFKKAFDGMTDVPFLKDPIKTTSVEHVNSELREV